ncbi:MAG: FAD binding domain-containing protein, partial [Alphaproteobacteria bacterium]|nr:FAD binding domain-containing protein [Alphaproteobacteria bacterium]
KPIQFVEQNNDVQLGLVSYHNPINLDELLNLTNKPNFRYLAGGTDLNLQRPIINEDQNTIINLGNIKELKNIEVQNNKLLFGSAVTIENFLVTIKDRIPELIELLQRFGSPQIRNQGTIGGNLCTSSPIGDIAPVFLALNAKLNIFGSNGRKKVNLNEFYTGYRKNILTKDEIVSSIEVPLPKKDYNLFCWKLSKRYDQDISTISLTVYIKIRDQIIDDIHLAAGGIAETPKYLDNLCKDMIGQKLDKSISLAINNIKNYIKPISDIRGTADYRIESFKGLFRRLEKCLIDGVKTMSIMDYNNE